MSWVNWIWATILIAGGLAVCLGIYRAQCERDDERNAIRDLTPDEESARREYREQDAAKVKALKAGRFDSAVAWKWENWPAAKAEVNARKFMEEVGE